MFSISQIMEMVPKPSTGLHVIPSAIAILCVLYSGGYAIYNLYLHSLRKFPGPKLWIAFPILRHVSAIRGLFDQRMREFHEVYGEVVRFAPNQLSFITAQAWKDIYGNYHKQLPKFLFKAAGTPSDIILSNDTDHARFRKILSPAFSKKALKDQEPLINIYIDLLIKKLKEIAVDGEKADMVKWYNLATFDLIGDLAFGDSFDGLENGTYDKWYATIFQTVKIIPFLRMAQDYPLVVSMLKQVMPKSITEGRDKRKAQTRMMVMKRINNRDGRPDFMDAMLKNKGEKDGLTDEELISNSNFLIIAGSETTATLLSGVTYWLMRTPDALSKVTKEVRTNFETESDINFASATARLPYMLACLEEGLRMYPPVPTGLMRYCLPGAPTEISGYQVPSGNRVSVHQSAANWSAQNFHLPQSYIPERWLPSATEPSSPFYGDKRAVLQPFSVGPRNCIGRNLAYNEMRLILARILWNFDLELCEESQKWNEQKTYLLWDKPALWCLLRLRKA